MGTTIVTGDICWKNASRLVMAAAIVHAVPALAQDNSEKSSDAIIVTGQQVQKQVVSDGDLGALGFQDALSTPFNVSTFTAKLVLDQQSETLGDVLKNDPSVRTTSGSGTQAELFMVRGFPLYGDDISIDGLFGITPRQLISPELYENIQVLNGASAFLFGAAPGGSGVGGGINLTPKRATKALYRVTASLSGKDILGGNFDVGRRFGPEEQFGLRVNGVYRDGHSGIDGEHKSVKVAGLGFDWRKGAGRVFLDLGYENQQVYQPRAIVRLSSAVTDMPVVPSDPSASPAQDWTYTKLRDIYGTLRTELDIAPGTMLTMMVGARDGREEGLYSALTVTNGKTGAATGSRLYVPREDNNEAGQIALRSKFKTGSISHQASLGASLNLLENRNAYSYTTFGSAVRSSCGAAATTYCTNLYTPVMVSDPGNTTLPATGGNLTDLPRSQTLTYGSIFASDTLGFFDDHVLITGGVRKQSIEVNGYSKADLRTTHYSRSAWTPVVGLVFKPSETISFYANRIEALVQGPTAPTTTGLSNGGEIFDPYVSKQYEAGGKVAIRGLTGTIAVYQTQQPRAYTDTARNLYVVDGEQRNRGVELSLNGEPTQWLRFIGGATYTQAKVVRGASTDIGKRVVGVPEWMVNFGTEIVPPFLRAATLTGRVVYTGPQFQNIANTLQIPAWTRIDLGARYVFVAGNHPMTFRVGVDNVANKAYWSSAFLGYLTQGAPRTLKTSLTFEY